MDAASKPPRVVGRVGAMLMSVNGMVGAGIFALPALLYAEVGAFAPWLFLIFGLLYASGILIAARLANMFRSSGGPQLWTQVAFGPLAGFQVGWVLTLAMAAGRAATLYVLVSYLAVIFPLFDQPVVRGLALALLLVGMTTIAVSGMRNCVGGLAIGTALKLAPLLLLIGFAAARGGVAEQAVLPDFSAFESIALLVYFAFSGTINSAYSAGELKNLRRDLPVTMLGSLALIITLYMAIQWAYQAAGSPQGASDGTPLAAAAAVVLGKYGALLISLAAIFSIATNCLAFYTAGPRVIYAMAERGLLPATFARVSGTVHTPDRAIYLFSTLVAIMMASGAFVFLASVVSLGANAIALATIGGFIVLMRRRTDTHDGNLPAYWWPVIFVATFFAAFTIAQATATAFALLGILLVAGTLLYWQARRGEITAPEPEFD